MIKLHRVEVDSANIGMIMGKMKDKRDTIQVTIGAAFALITWRFKRHADFNDLGQTFEGRTWNPSNKVIRNFISHSRAGIDVSHSCIKKSPIFWMKIGLV